MYDFGSRYYDPILGRWHSPDPADQFTNPYIGIGNNPVVYVDPDGEWIHILIGAIVGGAVNLAVNWKKADNFWQGLGYFGVGAAAGAAVALTCGGASGVGGLAGMSGVTAMDAAFIGGFVGGAINGAGNTAMAGGSAQDIISGAMFGGAIGGFSGAATAGILGGADKLLAKSWRGRQTALWKLPQGGRIEISCVKGLEVVLKGSPTLTNCIKNSQSITVMLTALSNPLPQNFGSGSLPLNYNSTGSNTTNNLVSDNGTTFAQWRSSIPQDANITLQSVNVRTTALDPNHNPTGDATNESWGSGDFMNYNLVYGRYDIELDQFGNGQIGRVPLQNNVSISGSINYPTDPLTNGRATGQIMETRVRFTFQATW